MHFFIQESLMPVCNPNLLTGKDVDGQLNGLARIYRRQNLQARMYIENELSSGALVAPWPGSHSPRKISAW